MRLVSYSKKCFSSSSPCQGMKTRIRVLKEGNEENDERERESDKKRKTAASGRRSWNCEISWFARVTNALSQL